MRSRFWLRLETSTATRPSVDRSTSVRPTSDSTTPLTSVQRRSSLADTDSAAGVGDVTTSVAGRLTGGGGAIAAEREDGGIGTLMTFGCVSTPFAGGVTAGAGDVTVGAAGAGADGTAADFALGAAGAGAVAVLGLGGAITAAPPLV